MKQSEAIGLRLCKHLLFKLRLQPLTDYFERNIPHRLPNLMTVRLGGNKIEGLALLRAPNL